MTGFDRRYQVMQHVAVVQNATGMRFRVYRTGEAGWYLFDPLDADGCSLCRAFPVRTSDLRPDLRRALAHGWGNCL